MADDKDPEYENMKSWAESQKERKLSPEKINDRLKRSIRDIDILGCTNKII